MNNFHNTTQEDAIYVAQRTEKNKSQEDIIYDIFKVHKKLTASDVLNLFPKNIPLTSVRRSCSNLQFSKKIQITTDKKEGIYGAPEKFYIISGYENRQFEMFNN